MGHCKVDFFALCCEPKFELRGRFGYAATSWRSEDFHLSHSLSMIWHPSKLSNEFGHKMNSSYKSRYQYNVISIFLEALEFSSTKFFCPGPSVSIAGVCYYTWILVHTAQGLVSLMTLIHMYTWQDAVHNASQALECVWVKQHGKCVGATSSIHTWQSLSSYIFPKKPH